MRIATGLAVLLTCQLWWVKAEAKSDWVEDESERSVSRQGLLPENVPEQLKQQPLSSSDTPSHGGSDAPLKAGVSRWGAGQEVQGPTSSSFGPRRSFALPQPQDTKTSPKDFQTWFARSHRHLVANIGAQGPKAKQWILELRGRWDDAGHALRTFGLPFTRISSDQLNKMALQDVRVIVVDCGCALDQSQQSIVRAFVAQGGYIITTDWALDACLTPCFPGYVEWNHEYTRPGVVDARVVSDDPLLTKGTETPAYWKMEKQSQFVKVLNPNVEVLAQSSMLRRDDPSGQGILALTFQYGQGQVLHIVGHFDTNSAGSFDNVLQDASPHIVVSLRQALAANFIAAALAERENASPPPTVPGE